jgi:competence protein ComEC
MKRWWIFLFIFLIIGVAWWWLNKPTPFTVTFFDVGEGESALVQTPSGQNILIDGGPSAAVLQKLGGALPWTKRNIDLIILSHPHADHITGVIKVLERYKVRQVLTTDVLHTTPEYIAFLKLIKDKKIPLAIARTGQNIKLASGVSVDILWPPISYAGQQVDDLNSTSIVNKINFGETSVLFTGDTPIVNEQALITTSTNLRSQILKVAHQGSRTSSSEEFLRAVAPEFAVISVGKDNRFGHPHQEVLERLKNLSIKIFRTDIDGDISFVSDGKRWAKK